MGFVLVLCGGAAAVVILSAIRCAKRRAYLSYLAHIAVLTIFLIIASLIDVPLHSPPLRSVVVTVLIFLPVFGTYAAVPGLQVMRMASSKAIVIATLLATAIAIPCWLILSLYVACYVGHDCL